MSSFISTVRLPRSVAQRFPHLSAEVHIVSQTLAHAFRGEGAVFLPAGQIEIVGHPISLEIPLASTFHDAGLLAISTHRLLSPIDAFTYAAYLETVLSGFACLGVDSMEAHAFGFGLLRGLFDPSADHPAQTAVGGFRFSSVWGRDSVLSSLVESMKRPDVHIQIEEE